MNNDKKAKSKNKFQKRSAEQKAATRKLTSRIFIGVSVALVLIFIVFIFITTNFMGSDSIVTETAVKTTVFDTVNTTGFVIRDEEYVANKNEGVPVFQVSDGDKLTANGTIATIYNNETDAVNFQRMCEIDDEIAELKTLNNISNSVNVGLDSVNNQLDLKLVSFIESVNKRNFNNISDIQSDLLSAIYRKQIITGDQKNFDKNITELEEEKARLESETNDSVGEIITESSGYYSSEIDGYEGMFSVDELKDLSYKEITQAKPKDVNKNNYVGKVIKGINWYLACPVTEEQAVAINHSNYSVTVKIPYATTESIPAKVVTVNQFAGDEKAIVVLECNYMNTALSQIRNEAVEIELNTYEGLKVSKKALHDDYVTKTTYDNDGNEKTQEVKVQGVYVKYGRQLLFKQVFVVYSDKDYVICSENPGNDVLINGSTISLYDEVVVEGDDLYDGKLID